MVLYEDDRYRYWRGTFLRKHYVLDRAKRRKMLAEDDDVAKLAAILRYLPKIPLGRGMSLHGAELVAYRMFCMATHGDDEAVRLFSGQKAGFVALVIATMPAV